MMKRLADYLRRKEKECFLVVNKTDGVDPDVAMSEFHGLGLGAPTPIAAAHGRGVAALVEYVLQLVPEVEVDEALAEAIDKSKRIAVVGRPNVGKSTLVNRMLGEDRVVVYDKAGTTRDSVYIPYERDGEAYTLIDTAGVRPS